MTILNLAKVAPQQLRAPAEVLIGRVTAFDGSRITVNLNGIDTEMPRARTYSAPAADDVVLVLKSGKAMYCLDALNAGAVVAPDPPPPPHDGKPPVVPSRRTLTFRPQFVGTYRGGWRGDTSDCYQGDWSGRGVNYGCAYYGNGPAGITGTAVSGSVKIKRLEGGTNAAQAPTLRLLTNRARPGGMPGSSATFLGPALSIGQSATVALPTAWVTALINGTAGGIGVGVASSSPYVHCAGVASWSSAFTLTITYSS